MVNQDKREGIKLGIAFAAIAIAVAWLLGIAGRQEEHSKATQAELHSAELATCWDKANTEGGVCRIEYLRDRTDTIYAAKVVYEK